MGLMATAKEINGSESDSKGFQVFFFNYLSFLVIIFVMKIIIMGLKTGNVGKGAKRWIRPRGVDKVGSA